ncbi:MAG: ABC transporter permease [Capsulimonadales bacterium]|nr:ABC transporter permease [Capsulimonadales bacterium]
MTERFFRPLLALLRPLLSLSIALLPGGLLIALVRHDPAAPIAAFASLLRGAVGSPSGWDDTLRLTTPLLLTGSAVFLALATGRFNIGGEGQMAVGALTAALLAAIPGVPPIVLLPLALVGGMVGGAVWALPPILLRERRGVHEVITALLFNYIAGNLTHFFASGPAKDAAGQAPQTAETVVWLPRLLPSYDVHFGLPIALSLAVACLIALFRTVPGFEFRAVGQGIDAARVAGISPDRVRRVAFVVSGALCGAAGAVTVLGETPFRRFPADFYGIGYGFDGLTVALLVAGAGFPRTLFAALALLPSALLFGALSAGGEAMAFDTETPKQVIAVVQAILILAVAARKKGSEV